MNEFLKSGIDFISTYGGRIIIAVLVFVIGCFVIKLLMKALGKAIDKLKMDETLKQIAKKFLRLLLYVAFYCTLRNVYRNTSACRF